MSRHFSKSDRVSEGTPSAATRRRNLSPLRRLFPFLWPYRLQISYESMRVTSRLTQVMAWLLAQKAVHAGEMSREQAASDDFALSGGEICTDPSGPDNEALPEGLRSLLERSHRLYMRVARLDERARDSVAMAG